MYSLLALSVFLLENGTGVSAVDTNGNIISTGDQTCKDGVCYGNKNGDSGVINEDDDTDRSYESMIEDQKEDDSSCVDTDERCQFWAKEGECDANPNYMLNYCTKSCDVCDNDSMLAMDEEAGCVDADENCPMWATEGQCEENIERIAICKKSCGICTTEFDEGKPQKVPFNAMALRIAETIRTSHTYYQSSVATNTTLALTVREGCQNRHEQCAEWATTGECTANPTYMKINCALVCQTCDWLDVSIRCPLKEGQPEALKAGDLNRLFEKIMREDEFRGYNPSLLSGPPGHGAGMEGPWVLALDNFLTDEECDHLIQKGHDKGYERSTGVGKLKFDGTNEAVTVSGRTSTNAWCNDNCFNTTVTKRVLEKMVNLTGVPSVNQEYLQLLRYEEGQYYRSHHDYLPNDIKMPWGPRILTLYVYLSDVEKGGGTRFTDLNLISEPKKGKAILWPSVLDEDPMRQEPNTNHEALNVIEGLKYGANAWLHMRDFRTPHDNGCA